MMDCLKLSLLQKREQVAVISLIEDQHKPRRSLLDTYANQPAITACLPRYYSDRPVKEQPAIIALTQRQEEAALCLRWLQIGD